LTLVIGLADPPGRSVVGHGQDTVISTDSVRGCCGGARPEVGGFHAAKPRPGTDTSRDSWTGRTSPHTAAHEQRGRDRGECSAPGQAGGDEQHRHDEDAGAVLGQDAEEPTRWGTCHTVHAGCSTGSSRADHRCRHGRSAGHVLDRLVATGALTPTHADRIIPDTWPGHHRQQHPAPGCGN